ADELLDEDVLIQALERLDDRTGRGRALGQDDAEALRALQQLDNHRRAVHALDTSGNVLGLGGIDGGGQANVMSAEDLQAAQLVARAGDGLRFVHAVNAHHLELAHHRQPEERDRRANARNDRIDMADRLALVKQLWILPADLDIELKRI